jgi:hypothetical protein
MPTAFLRLACAVRPESMHHEEARRFLVVTKISGNLTDRISSNPLHAKFAEILFQDVRE